MDDLLSSLRDVTKDTMSHIAVSGMVVLSHENIVITAIASVGMAVLATAWVYHLYASYRERKLAREAGGQ